MLTFILRELDMKALARGFPLLQNCLYAQDYDLASEEMLQMYCFFFFFFSRRQIKEKAQFITVHKNSY